MGNCVCPECPRQPCYSRTPVIFASTLGALAALCLLCLVGWSCHKLGQRQAFKRGYKKGMDDEERRQQSQKMATTRGAVEMAWAALGGRRLSTIGEEMAVADEQPLPITAGPHLPILARSPQRRSFETMQSLPHSPPTLQGSHELAMTGDGRGNINQQHVLTSANRSGGKQHFKSNSGDTFIL